MAMPERELDQAKRHPDVVKNIIKKDGRKDAIPYSPSNPPPATEGGRVWYATCSTASGTGAKVATSSTGDFVLANGSMVRVKFTTSNTAANPTISIDGSAAKTIQPKSGTSGMANLIAAGEVVDLVYDGTNFIMTKGGSATTTFYGITKLNSSTSSTSTTEAATPSAVKDVADAKVDRAGDTMTGNLYVTKAGNAFVQAENSNTGVKLNLDTGGGANHGIYSYGYYDGSSFHSGETYMIYRNGSGNVIVNGHSTDDFNLQLGTNIPDNSNLNDYKTAGTYYVADSTHSATITNSPTNAAGYKLVVFYSGTTGQVHQEAYLNASLNRYYRYWNGSYWSAWRINLTTNDTIGIVNGGTGATNAATALSNLGALPANTITSGTWTPKIYDYETYKRDMAPQVYIKTGRLYVLFLAESPFQSTTFNTMIQIRNAPCPVWGGVVYVANVAGQGGTWTVQGSGSYIYLRPNYQGTLSGGIFQGVFFGYGD